MGTNICDNLNLAFRQVMSQPHAEWVWIQNDDQVFNPDLLMRLLDREVDVVTPLVFRRLPPFSHVTAFDENEDGVPLNFATNELPLEGGMIEALGTGTAGMLIRRNAIEAVEDPWFYWDIEMGEDYRFCKRLREAGFKIHLDLDNAMGHLSICEIWPGRNKATNEWAIDVGWQSRWFVQIPKILPDPNADPSTQGADQSIVPDEDGGAHFEPAKKPMPVKT